MPYSRLYDHALWGTFDRTKVHDCTGIVHAVAVLPDHVHLATSLPPSVAPADAIGRIKGSAAFLVRRRDQELVRLGVRWQSEYGILSFGERAFPMT